MHISTVRQENEIAGRENSPNVTRCYFWAWLELYKLSTRHILFLMRKIKWFKKKKSWLYLPRKPLNLGFHPALLPQCWGANTQERSVFSLNSPLPASLFSISRLCWMWNPDATGIDLYEVTSPGLYFMIFQYHDAGWTHAFSYKALGMLVWSRKRGQQVYRQMENRDRVGWGGGINECVTGQVGPHLSGAAGPVPRPLGPASAPLWPTALYCPSMARLAPWLGFLWKPWKMLNSLSPVYCPRFELHENRTHF